MKLLRRIILAVLAVIVVLYAAVVVYMYVNQRALQYDPTGEVVALADAGLPQAQEVTIPSGDGVVNGWYQPPQPGKPLIIYYKGNAGSFSSEHERFEQWVADGYGFLSFDYRGFPLSPGTISQDNILQDALAAFDWAAGQGAPIVIWGRSIGTGPASYVASERQADALLLETPFYSAVSVAAERYPILPVYWVMQDQYPVNDWMAKIDEPVLVAHGTADQTITVGNGERVYELAKNKGELWIEPGADHNDLWDRGIWSHAEPFFEQSEVVAGR
ncbi:alpha/beta hydrolase [Devosia yakushimensis]|uniref:Alpha/beta hydrolase n=1 Tax=Devosia yakushimensis TaxID=470028 RepID=A0ABQ5UM68_9HYPH|nr:alpha/beta hydrolase [Devosia yakushimensis]GLQ11816.1 alpha/beta hydrolase [Devosia yakushimensis]